MDVMEQNKFDENEIEIDLKEIFFILLRKFWIIVVSGIGLAAIAFYISKFVLVPTYESTTKVYILNKQENTSTITYADLQSGSQLTKDYMTLVTSRPVIEQVIATLNMNLTYSQLAGMVKVENPADTRLLNIKVIYTDPYMAKKIADEIREASSVHIKSVMDIDSVNKAEDANIPEGPSSPNVRRNTVFGGLAGSFLSAALIILVFLLDDTMKTPDDIEKHLGISVLSSIPYQENLVKKKRKKD
jgi:capsular polysaccharide biosynthesis protein